MRADRAQDRVGLGHLRDVEDDRGTAGWGQDLDRYRRPGGLGVGLAPAHGGDGPWGGVDLGRARDLRGRVEAIEKPRVSGAGGDVWVRAVDAEEDVVDAGCGGNRRVERGAGRGVY